MDHPTLYVLVGLIVVTLGVLGWQRAKIRGLTEKRDEHERRLAALEERPVVALDAGTGAVLAEVQVRLTDVDRRLEVCEDEVSSAWVAWAALAAKGYRVETLPPLSTKKKPR